MKRWLIAIAIFLGSIIVLQAILLLPVLLRMYRVRVAGFAFVSGSLAENLVRIIVLVLLGLLAFWLSGKLVKT